MKIIITGKDKKELCDIWIDPCGVVEVGDGTIDDIEMDEGMNNITYLKVRLLNGERLC